MSFKKTLICLGLSAFAFSSMNVAFAEGEEPVAPTFDVSTGTVDFVGSIVNTPCAITATNKSLKVTLGDVKADVFTKKGDLSDSQNFDIVLSNCTVAATPYHASVSFNGNATDIGKTSLAVNAGSDTSGAGIAKGVGVQILDSTNTPLVLNVPSAPVVIDKSEISLPFTARYISTLDTVSPGLANAHADFTVSYD